ncbi:MAG: LysE family transporter [Chloroflexi bacterium]|nr:LysE family transporter [Chloroflexota bacterium]
MGFETAFGAALSVWLVALIAPGPDFAATVHASVTGSRRAGLGVAAGVTVGMAAWASSSLLGLHAVVDTFAGLATLLRLAGGTYLAYLGGRLLWAAWRGGTGRAAPVTPTSTAGAFRRGLVTNLSNPKALALFSSLFALLVPPGAPAWFTPGLLLSVVVSAGCWYTLVAFTMSSGVMASAYRRLERGLTAVTGAVFVAVGVRLAVEPR